jgi:hypothetical protein
MKDVAEPELTRIENKTFSPSETVILDGNFFINCVFDGCELVYSGDSFTHENTTSGRPCNVMLYGAAQRTVQLLEFCGWKITSPFGEKPRIIPFQ